MHKLKTTELPLENTTVTIDFYDCVNSTMYLLNESFLDNFYTVVARLQTNGYGRLKRSFESQDGGLYFSTQIKSRLPLTDFTAFSLVSGLSILRVINNKFPQLDISLKYPNDIYINNKKFGGILIENIKNNYYILGIGLNINNQISLENLKDTVTNLSIETGIKNIDINLLLKDILNELHSNYLVFENQGFTPFYNEYEKNCLNLKKEVYVTYKGKKHLSKGQRVLENGLLLALIDNQEVII